MSEKFSGGGSDQEECQPLAVDALQRRHEETLSSLPLDVEAGLRQIVPTPENPSPAEQG